VWGFTLLSFGLYGGHWLLLLAVLLLLLLAAG
jgi:hypothetical protein